MSEIELYRAKMEMLSKITLTVRQMAKEKKSAADVEEYLITNQMSLVSGSRLRPSRAKTTGLPLEEPKGEG